MFMIFGKLIFVPDQFLARLGLGVRWVLASAAKLVKSSAQMKMSQKRRGIGRIETISPAVIGGSNGGLTIKASAWTSVAIIELS